ncbi:hypothetical protein K9L27_00320 [Candidatus Gracilibacteria bacterium]|nr:hypothetical protein [Candidatus Gracilibacteria bacterium]
MENKYKLSGASIIELMVAIAIIGILTGIVVPNFSRLFSYNNFQEETREILNSISDARANALASKECRNQEELIFWSFTLTTPPVITTLSCNSLPTGTPLINKTKNISANTEVSTIELADGTAINTLTLLFETETSQSKINNGNQQSARIVFTHPSSGKQRTLCFNSIAGFPTLSEGDTPFPCP